MEPLVATGWLAGELGAGDLKLIDASWFLDDRDGAAEFAQGHIPGAVFLDLDAVADRGDPLPHMLPPPAQFAEQLGALGVGDGDRIVVYDNSPLHSAARAWWMLQLMGTRRVAILDGGLAKWRTEGRPVETGEATRQLAKFAVLGDAAGRVGLAGMKAAVAHRDQIVDAHSPARFRGEEPEPRPGVRPGHIPGSINLHYAALFEADGTWKDRDAIAAAFAAAGVETGHPIVTTCGSGITAAVLVFALHLIGARDVTLYDGSWADWGADPATPKVTA